MQEKVARFSLFFETDANTDLVLLLIFAFLPVSENKTQALFFKQINPCLQKSPCDTIIHCCLLTIKSCAVSPSRVLCTATRHALDRANRYMIIVSQAVMNIYDLYG